MNENPNATKSFLRYNGRTKPISVRLLASPPVENRDVLAAGYTAIWIGKHAALIEHVVLEPK